jgi:NAD(P)-dependent dehydrogenase (short-subunit alcohol dehydrogenase family)
MDSQEGEGGTMTERSDLIAVTGAASGLGAALAKRLGESGRSTLGIDLTGTDVDADLASAAGRKAAIEAILARGNGRLEGLVVAAGVGPYGSPETIVAVNYFGSMQLIDELRPALAEGREAAAVTIASIGGFFDGSIVSALVDACLEGDEPAALALSREVTGTQAYSSVKRAIVIATRRRAAEWGAAGVRLNCVVPGNMSTPMLEGVYATAGMGDETRAMPVPLGRDGAAAEVAAVVAFLLGEGASYVHGAAVPVDGGVLAGLQPDPFEGPRPGSVEVEG